MLRLLGSEALIWTLYHEWLEFRHTQMVVRRIRKVISQSRLGEMEKMKMSLSESMAFYVAEALGAWWRLVGNKMGESTNWEEHLNAQLRNDFTKGI